MISIGTIPPATPRPNLICPLLISVDFCSFSNSYLMLRTVFRLSLVSRPVSRLIKSQIRSMAKFSSVHDFTVKNLQGEPVSLSKYKGKVILIENVASLWGTTVRDYTQVCNMNLRKWVFHLGEFSVQMLQIQLAGPPLSRLLPIPHQLPGFKNPVPRSFRGYRNNKTAPLLFLCYLGLLPIPLNSKNSIFH